MHDSSLLRMEWFKNEFAVKKENDIKLKVLDIGSADINGCYKPIFNDNKYEYVGLDLNPGKNVDIVVNNPYNWSMLDTESFDIIISGQAFEHIEFIWLTIAEITRVLKKDGLLCIIAPHGFPEHRHPVDCYRFFSDGLIALIRYVKLETLHVHTNATPDLRNIEWFVQDHADSMIIATKPYFGDTQYIDPKTYECIPAVHKTLLGGLIPIKYINYGYH